MRTLKVDQRIQRFNGLTEEMTVLEEARRLREAFAARYGVLEVDLVRVAREEREARRQSGEAGGTG